VSAPAHLVLTVGCRLGRCAAESRRQHNPPGRRSRRSQRAQGLEVAMPRKRNCSPGDRSRSVPEGSLSGSHVLTVGPTRHSRTVRSMTIVGERTLAGALRGRMGVDQERRSILLCLPCARGEIRAQPVRASGKMASTADIATTVLLNGSPLASNHKCQGVRTHDYRLICTAVEHRPARDRRLSCAGCGRSGIRWHGKKADSLLSSRRS
jgi:hypothetical protein